MPAVLTASTVAHVVVLALVVLAALEPGLAAAGAGDGDAELEQPPQGRPLAELGAEDVGVGLFVSRREQGFEGARVGGGVVVEDPDPLAVGGVLEPELDAPRGTTCDPGAVTTEPKASAQQVGAVVLAAGVDRDDAVDRGPLARGSLDDGGEPAGAVMADEEGGDRGIHGR